MSGLGKVSELLQPCSLKGYPKHPTCSVFTEIVFFFFFLFLFWRCMPSTLRLIVKITLAPISWVYIFFSDFNITSCDLLWREKYYCQKMGFLCPLAVMFHILLSLFIIEQLFFRKYGYKHFGSHAYQWKHILSTKSNRLINQLKTHNFKCCWQDLNLVLLGCKPFILVIPWSSLIVNQLVFL